MELSKLSKTKTKSKKRIGRGAGSGKGAHTVGRGAKGQGSRSGYKKLKAWIRESGVKSLPKLKGIGKRSALRGYFKNKYEVHTLQVSDLNQFPDQSVITVDFLQKNGVFRNKSKNSVVKILGGGEIKIKVTVKGVEVSDGAREKIEKAGGKVQ